MLMDQQKEKSCKGGDLLSLAIKYNKKNNHKIVQ